MEEETYEEVDTELKQYTTLNKQSRLEPDAYTIVKTQPIKKGEKETSDDIKRSKHCSIIAVFIAIVTGCLALIITAAVAGAVVATQDSSNALLSHHIQEIRSKQNVSSIELQILKMESKLNSFQSSLDTFNTANSETRSELNHLQLSVNALNITDNVFMTQLNSLQSSVNSLTTRVNSPVNLYQNCIQETRNCTIGPRTTNTYWTWCETAYGPISRAVILGTHTQSSAK